MSITSWNSYHSISVTLVPESTVSGSILTFRCTTSTMPVYHQTVLLWHDTPLAHWVWFIAWPDTTRYYPYIHIYNSDTFSNNLPLHSNFQPPGQNKSIPSLDFSTCVFAPYTPSFFLTLWMLFRLPLVVLYPFSTVLTRHMCIFGLFHLCFHSLHSESFLTPWTLFRLSLTIFNRSSSYITCLNGQRIQVDSHFSIFYTRCPVSQPIPSGYCQLFLKTMNAARFSEYLHPRLIPIYFLILFQLSLQITTLDRTSLLPFWVISNSRNYPSRAPFTLINHSHSFTATLNHHS